MNEINDEKWFYTNKQKMHYLLYIYQGIFVVFEWIFLKIRMLDNDQYNNCFRNEFRRLLFQSIVDFLTKKEYYILKKIKLNLELYFTWSLIAGKIFTIWLVASAICSRKPIIEFAIILPNIIFIILIYFKRKENQC